MGDVIEVSCEVTRDDWVRVNETLVRESPAWAEAAAEQTRAARRQAVRASPLAVAFGVVVIGRAFGGGREGAMVGGAIGAAFAAFLLWALPRVDFLGKQKREALARVRAADVSDFVGPTTVAVSPEGVVVRARGREMTLGWSVASVASVGGTQGDGAYVLVQYAQGGGAIVPRRAFASDEAMAAFVERAQAWWRAGQVPAGQRLKRYLADLDVARPTCGYGLRGVGGEWCPECGRKLVLEEFVAREGRL
jgi:hypothetical protein